MDTTRFLSTTRILRRAPTRPTDEDRAPVGDLPLGVDETRALGFYVIGLAALVFATALVTG